MNTFNQKRITIKKIYASFAFILFSLVSNAAVQDSTLECAAIPVILLPYYSVNKFFFDKNQHWVINISSNRDTIPPDSVLVCSSTGKSICKKYIKNAQTIPYSFTLNYDSLSSNVIIKPEGDSVTILFYSNSIDTIIINGIVNRYQGDQFVFGNYRNATIPKPRNGQSIVPGISNFQISPLLQEMVNCIADSSGNTRGSIHGHVYNEFNKLITNVSLSINPFLAWSYCWCLNTSYIFPDTFIVNNDGSYSAKLLSLIYHFGTINICGNNACGVIGIINNANIDSLNFTLEPDTSVLMDIHILSDFTDINTVMNNQNVIFRTSPNPLNSNTFNYEISTTDIPSNSFINLIQINGQEIMRYNINNNTGVLQLPENISNGTYLLQLNMNNAVFATTKIIVLLK